MEGDAAKIEQVVRWFVEGSSLHLIREGIEGSWPGTDPQPLIDAASAEIERLGGWDVAAARFIYQKQIEIGEYSDAARTLKEIERLRKASNSKDPETPPSPALLIDPKHATSEVNLLGRAIKNGWPIRPEIMAQLPEILANVALTGDSRAKVAAARVLVAMHSQNQKSKPIKKKVTHVHELGPKAEASFDERRRAIDERLAGLGEDAGRTGAGGNVAQ